MKELQDSVWRDGIGYCEVKYMVIEINWKEDI